jgi:carboxypeptidase C (cathepsin A)
MNGGPGSSSMVGLFQENGPCEVIEIARDKFGTRAREWGWDRSSNIVYIDQPNQVGFSYDFPTNGSLNLFTSEILFPPSSAPPDQPAYTFLNGTFSSQVENRTANTTEIAAQTVWHLLQGFLSIFPQYNPGLKPHKRQPGVVGVNLFVESYGGKYGPTFAAYWEEQNLRRSINSDFKNRTLEVRLTSVGIIQGCIDDTIQGRFYPMFANNNTYGIKTISLADEQASASNFLSVDGCQQLIQSCRNTVASMDPKNYGDNVMANQNCKNASTICNNNFIGSFQNSGRDIYDITQKTPNPFPSGAYLEYLNVAEVQAAIGAAVNYTETSAVVADAFLQTGDYERGDQISDMVFLLSLGIRVALIYGDRDFICNWVGGEAVSFAIAAGAPAHSPFYSAGYADIVVNETYIGGAVRQFGNLSFSRIYDAGHLVPAYQPETAFTVFTRIIMGTDISLGEPIDLTKFSSSGTANSTYTNNVPDQVRPECYIRNIERSCSEEQEHKIRKGEGDVVNGVFYVDPSDWASPASSVILNAGFPGDTSSTIGTFLRPSDSALAATITQSVATGVFVATSTPSTRREGAAPKAQSGCVLILFDIGLLLGLVWFGY